MRSNICPVTARDAGKIIRQYLQGQGLIGFAVTARTVSFSDLARGSAIFVHIEDGEALTQAEWRQIGTLATNNGFFIG